jgi:hypothetical protein
MPVIYDYLTSFSSSRSKKRCLEILNSYFYATPSVGERLFREVFRNEKKYIAKAVRGTAKFEKAFEGGN